jgi:hypothetical protein
LAAISAGITANAKEKRMVEKWLHLDFEAEGPWGYAISTAIQQAIKAGKVPPARRTLSQMPLHIHTRLSMLSRVVRRLHQECEALYERVKKHNPEHVSRAGHKAFVFRVDDDLKYCLLADIDSFIFEIDACLDLFINLNYMVHGHTGKNISRDESRKLLKNAAAAAGQGNGDPRWFHDLDRARNTFIHNATPYIAVDLSEEENNKYDLLIMRENLHEFSDESKFIRLSGLNNVGRCFFKAVPIFEKFIASLYG